MVDRRRMRGITTAPLHETLRSRVLVQGTVKKEIKEGRVTPLLTNAEFAIFCFWRQGGYIYLLAFFG